MSEHVTIEGFCDYHHEPYDWKGGFCYCHHCKTLNQKLSLTLHDSACSDWIQVNCFSCKKTIWTAELTTDPEYYKKADGGRHIVTEKNKCRVCGKTTNMWDAVSYSYTEKGRVRCCCSVKCMNKYMKGLEKKRK